MCDECKNSVYEQPPRRGARSSVLLPQSSSSLNCEIIKPVIFGIAFRH